MFKDKMSTFLQAAEEKLKTENENLEECRAKFIATVKFYQYTPKKSKLEDCEPKEFFSLWTSFCSDFKDIYKKEEQLAVKERYVFFISQFFKSIVCLSGTTTFWSSSKSNSSILFEILIFIRIRLLVMKTCHHEMIYDAIQLYLDNFYDMCDGKSVNLF